MMPFSGILNIILFLSYSEADKEGATFLVFLFSSIWFLNNLNQKDCMGERF